MVYRQISADLKQRALYLWDEGWMSNEVCDVLGISFSSLKRWKWNLEKHGSVIPPHNPLQGRPSILNDEQVHDIVTRISHAPDKYIDEIQEIIVIYHDKLVSRSIVRELIHDAGLTWKRLRRAAAERDDEERAVWLNYMRENFTAEQLVAVDESSKDDRVIYRHYGWAPSGQRAVISASFGRGTRYSILPALTLDGYIATRIVQGSVNGQEFFDFITEDVLPKMKPYPADKSILLLDNCAIHKSAVLRETVEAAGCLLIFLPPYSPDFNPIEESFSSVKASLRRNYRRVKESLYPEIELLEACATVTAEKAAGWFRHSGYLRTGGN